MAKRFSLLKIGRVLLGAGIFSLYGALSAPCNTSTNVEFTVESSQDASLAAEMVNCAGGDFSIEWVGNIVVPTAFNISGGTTLSVHGGSTEQDIMDGALSNQLFTVAGGELNLEGLTMTGAFTNGEGGMLYATESVVTVTDCVIAGNMATEGGAVFLHESHLEIYGVTTFESNLARYDGGETFSRVFRGVADEVKINLSFFSVEHH